MLPLSRLRRHHADERGVALVAVIILVVVSVTIAATVAYATIYGTVRTSTQEARLQALAAAEAGRDATLAALAGNPSACQTTYASPVPSTSPAASYSANVYWASSASSAPATPPAAPSCPAATSGYLGIKSTGFVAGTSKTVLAWYPYKASVVPGAPGAVTTTTTTTTATGLSTGAIVQGGVPTGQTALTSITVTGSGGDVFLNVSSASSINCNGTSISGDLVLDKASGSAAGPTLDLSGCSIGGSLYAYGNVDAQNAVPVGGDAVSEKGSLTLGSAVQGKASAYGSITIDNPGTVSGSASCASPNCRANLGSAVPNVMPTIDWYDYDTTVAHWVSAGYQLKTLGSKGTLASSTSCDFAQGSDDTKLIAAVDALTRPTVIDATGCTAPSGSNPLAFGGTFKLQTDVTFITPGFTSPNNSFTVDSSSTGAHQFNVIQPDTTTSSSDPVPNCTNGAVNSMTGWAMGDAHVSGVVYSPCTVTVGGPNMDWRGQIFAGVLAGTGSTAVISYLPITGLVDAAPSGGFGTVTTTATATATAAASPSSVVKSVTPTLIQETEP